MANRLMTVNAASNSFRSTTLTNAAVAVSSDRGGISSIHVGNLSGVRCFLHLYDLAPAQVTVGTTVPTRSYEIAAGGILDKEFPIPLNFLVAITAAITTTPGGNTAPSTLPDITQIEFI